MIRWDKFFANVAPPSGPDVFRFSDGANLGQCTEWTGQLHHDGYGKCCRGGKRAHRYMWMFHFGDAGKLYVLHHCDNPKCVNIRHLWLGTEDDNRRDMIAKGRHGKGDTHWAKRNPWKVRRGFKRPDHQIHRGEQVNQSNLKASDIPVIRAEYSNGGISQQALADRYGIKQQNISAIIRRKAWSHIP